MSQNIGSSDFSGRILFCNLQHHFGGKSVAAESVVPFRMPIIWRFSSINVYYLAPMVFQCYARSYLVKKIRQS